MNVMTQEPLTEETSRRDVASRLLVPEFWAALTIVTMWLAVLFVGIFGGNMVFANPPGVTTIPSAVAVAVFAAIGTSAMAKRVFRRKGMD